MKSVMVSAVALLMMVPFATSCTTLRSATATKGAFASEAKDGPTEKREKAPEKAEAPPADQTLLAEQIAPATQASWASRHIPGWRALTAYLPPPTDARMKWDEYYKSQGSIKGSQDRQRFGF
ncbi:MAG: hypothetical protein AB1646_11370 [Thermodesulfobacteriota bacterium]